MALGKLIEQLSLEVRPRKAIQLLLKLTSDEPLQLIETRKPEGLSELIVDLGLARGLDRSNAHRKDCVFTLQGFDRIIRREGDLDLAGIPRLCADKLILKSRNQSSRTKLDRHGFTFAAVEWFAVHLAFKIHDDEIADFCAMFLGSVVPMLGLVRELFDLFVNRRLIGIDRQSFKLKPFDLCRRHLGKRFETDVNLDVLAGLI